MPHCDGADLVSCFYYSTSGINVDMRIMEKSTASKEGLERKRAPPQRKALRGKEHRLKGRP
jgi:hypothetical protein